MAFVFIGQVNILAPIVTINFMLTYSAVDYSYFSVTMSYNLQRCYKVSQAAPKTPSSSQPLILDKSTSYGSNGTLLAFTKDMDQLFKEGCTESTNSTKTPEKKEKNFMKLKKSRKPAKQTLQDSFQLDLKQNTDLEGPTANRTVEERENREVAKMADSPDYGNTDQAANKGRSTPDQAATEGRSTPDQVQEDGSTTDEGRGDHEASEEPLDNQGEAGQCMCDEEEYVEGTGDQEKLFTEANQPGAEEREGK